MEDLEKIRKGYWELFNRTGMPEFFVRAKNIELLEKNIALVEELKSEEENTLSF